MHLICRFVERRLPCFDEPSMWWPVWEWLERRIEGA